MALSRWSTSFGLKPLILTRSEAAGWQLVHVVGVVPNARALGPAPGQVSGACSSLLPQPSSNP
jgi:hypothetical protein